MASNSQDQPRVESNNRVERVAIVGAGGTIGQFYTKYLIASGRFNVTALTRLGSTTKIQEGVSVVSIDYSDDNQLVSALEGHQVLIISLAVAAPREAQVQLIRAASKAGVMFVIPNAQNPDPEDEAFGAETMMKAQADAAINAVLETKSNLKYIILNNSFWYEFSLSGGSSTYGFDIPSRKVTFVDDGGAKIPTTTWDQCGRAMASLLSLPVYPKDESDQGTTLSHFSNGYVFIKSFVLSQRDMLDSLHRVLGTTDQDWVIKKQEHGERYRQGIAELQAGKTSGYSKMLYTRFFYPGSMKKYLPQVGNQVLGLPDESLDEATRRAVEIAEGRKEEYGDNEEAHKKRLENLKD